MRHGLNEFLPASQKRLRPGWFHGAMRIRRSSLLTLTAAVAAGALIGAGGGVGTYAALSGNSKTVVRQVNVGDSQPAASTRPLRQLHLQAHQSRRPRGE